MSWSSLTQKAHRYLKRRNDEGGLDASLTVMRGCPGTLPPAGNPFRYLQDVRHLLISHRVDFRRAPLVTVNAPMVRFKKQDLP